MARVSDHDTTKESVQLQEFVDEITSLFNAGTFEIQSSASQPPAYDAPQEPQLVLSKVGATVRLYCSYLGTWYYVALTS